MNSIMTVLPLFFIGITVIMCVIHYRTLLKKKRALEALTRFTKEKQANSETPDIAELQKVTKKLAEGDYVSLGLGVGMGMGSVIGATFLKSVLGDDALIFGCSFGMMLGTLIGFCLNACLRKK